MCGITGIIANQLNTSADYREQITRMNNTQIHRGPDHQAIWNNAQQSLYLGHTRLSIIDLSANGNQPMQSTDGRYIICFNGEIYNYKELKQACLAKGSRFQSETDTEVILESYRHWGIDVFKQFSGMWALALYDLKMNQLILVRDPFAIKPLYYGYANGDLYFASEIKALRAVANSFNQVDEITVSMFETQGVLERGDWTFFKNIKRFPHAHYSIINLNKPQPSTLSFQRYWSPPEVNPTIKMEDAANELQRLIKQSIKLHMRSDVPIGACLSGGIDSSTIVSLASQKTDHQFTTFTTHYPSYPHLDETDYAKLVVNQTQAKAHFVEPSYQDFINGLGSLLYHQDEPFGSTSIFAQYAIFKHIAQTDIKVVLDGQGPDEMLAGYHSFFSGYLHSLWKQHRYLTTLIEGCYLLKKTHFSYDYKTMVSALIKRIRRTSAAPSAVSDEVHCRMQQLTSPTNFTEQLTSMVIDANLPQLLRYEDRNSMAFSIESRVPFIETNIINFCLSLPANLRIHRGFTKAVLREAIQGIIPEEIRLRTDKLGFPAPELEWLRRAFNIDVKMAGSNAWRRQITQMWRQMLIGNSR